MDSIVLILKRLKITKFQTFPESKNNIIINEERNIIENKYCCLPQNQQYSQ
jgi:hypothetical protein